MTMEVVLFFIERSIAAAIFDLFNFAFSAETVSQLPDGGGKYLSCCEKSARGKRRMTAAKVNLFILRSNWDSEETKSHY